MPSTDGLTGFLEERHLRLAIEVEEYCREELAPLAAAEDDQAARRQALEILRSLGEAGWLEYAVPRYQDLDLRALKGSFQNASTITRLPVVSK